MGTGIKWEQAYTRVKSRAGHLVIKYRNVEYRATNLFMSLFIKLIY